MAKRKVVVVWKGCGRHKAGRGVALETGFCEVMGRWDDACSVYELRVCERGHLCLCISTLSFLPHALFRSSTHLIELVQPTSLSLLLPHWLARKEGAYVTNHASVSVRMSVCLCTYVRVCAFHYQFSSYSEDWQLWRYNWTGMIRPGNSSGQVSVIRQICLIL